MTNFGWMVGLQLTVYVGANGRTLNGSGSNGSADNVKGSSETPGGAQAR